MGVPISGDQGRSIPSMLGLSAAAIPALLFALNGLAGTAPGGARPASAAPAASTPAGEAPTGDWCKQRLREAVDASAWRPEDTASLRKSPQPSSGPPWPFRANVAVGALSGNVSGIVGTHEADPAPVVPAAQGAQGVSEPPLVLVATVADPIDSGDRRSFDSDVAAIQIAMSQAAWLRDRQWLPWDDPLLLSAGDRPYAAMCRRDVPGVLAFRRESSARSGPRRALVYLVGETPTWGVHTNALQYALKQTERPDLQDVHIVGPTFSGSASSLRAGIEEWRRHDAATLAHVRVHVVAGSANGPALAEELDQPGENIELASPNVGIDRLECAFWRYLASEKNVSASPRRHVLKSVGLIHELGTAYGVAHPADEHRSGDEVDARKIFGCDLSPEVDLQFPIHVASIRDAYAASDGKPSSAPADLARKTYLDLPLGEEPGTDEPMNQSALTAASRDTALAHLLTEVSTEGIRYLGIVATTTADTLFLARKIRDVAPDVRLVFFSNDVLLTHPAARTYTAGSYVVTPYPFLGSDDFALKDDDDHSFRHLHLPLETDASEAVLNATLDALGPPASDLRVEAGWPVGPFVWIGAVGASDVIPIAMAQVPVNAGDTKTPAPSVEEAKLRVERDVTPPTLWQVALLLLVVFAFRDVQRESVRAPAMKTEPGDLAPASVRDWDLAMLRWRYAMSATVRFTMIAAALAYMTGLDLLGLMTYHHGAKPGAVVRAFVFASAVAAIAATTWRAAKNGRAFIGAAWKAGLSTMTPLAGDEHAPSDLPAPSDLLAKTRMQKVRRLEAGRLAFLVLAIGLGLWATAPCFLWYALEHTHGRSDANGTLFVLRSLLLIDGVSPAWPIVCLLAGVYVRSRARMDTLWLRFGTILRARSSGAGGTTLALSGVLCDPAQDDGFARAELDLIDAGLGAVPRADFWMVAAGASLPLVLFTLRPPSTLDGVSSTWMLLFGFTFVHGLCIASLAHLTRYWRALRVLLARLAAHPAGAWLELADERLSLRSVFELPKTRSDGRSLRVLAELFQPLAGYFEPEFRDKMKAERHGAEELRFSKKGEASVETEGQYVGVRVCEAARWAIVLRDRARLARSDDRLCEIFVASVIASLVRRYTRPLGSMMFGLVGQALLLLAAIAGYAVEPKRLLLTYTWLLMLSVAAVGLSILIDANRNGTLSRLSGKKPGQVWSWDFAIHALRWAAIPILAMLAAEYPGAAGSAWTTIGPMLRVFH